MLVVGAELSILHIPESQAHHKELAKQALLLEHQLHQQSPNKDSSAQNDIVKRFASFERVNEGWQGFGGKTAESDLSI